MHYTYNYVVDWDKVETLDDMKQLIAAMDIGFEPCNKQLESVMDLVTRKEKPSEVGLSLSCSSIQPTWD